LVSLRGTSNSVDVLAENANHTVLALDETAMMQAKDLESLVFSVTSGAGKARMNITGQGLRKSSVWQTFVLISGEQSLAQRFEDATGKKMAKGAAARLLDVDVDALDVTVSDLDALRRIEGGMLENFRWWGKCVSGSPRASICRSFRLMTSPATASKRMGGMTVI
jgi:hypothetical protein